MALGRDAHGLGAARLADHQWHAQVRPNGHPWKTKTFTTRADAERWSPRGIRR